MAEPDPLASPLPRRWGHNRDKDRGGHRRLAARCRVADAEAEAIDLVSEVPGIEVQICLGGDARIAVAHDPLHGGEVRAPHRERAAGRVPEIVEADRPHDARDPEEGTVRRTSPCPIVVCIAGRYAAGVDAIALFADKAAEYARYRFGYPPEVVDAVFEAITLAPTDVIADLGSGTGLLARHFLERGNRVLGVEPNADMRRAAEAALSGFGARFVSVGGSAERTSLGPGAVDVVAAGNALHLFDPSTAPAEARRILVPGGRRLVIGHDFAATPNPFMRAYATFVAEVAAADVAVFHAQDRAAAALEAFFADCKGMNATSAITS